MVLTLAYTVRYTMVFFLLLYILYTQHAHGHSPIRLEVGDEGFLLIQRAWAADIVGKKH